jgi:hypothetical protein
VKEPRNHVFTFRRISGQAGQHISGSLAICGGDGSVALVSKKASSRCSGHESCSHCSQCSRPIRCAGSFHSHRGPWLHWLQWLHTAAQRIFGHARISRQKALLDRSWHHHRLRPTEPDCRHDCRRLCADATTLRHPRQARSAAASGNGASLARARVCSEQQPQPPRSTREGSI